MNKYMKEAFKMAELNNKREFKDGGPFGAVLVKNGKIIIADRNRVFEANDPTAHAEINVIRKAGEILKTNNLEGCELYTTCYPCPMCLSAIIWANIKTVYYGNTKEDADEIGFRDDFIYKKIANLTENKTIELIQLEREQTIKTFEDFKKNPKLY